MRFGRSLAILCEKNHELLLPIIFHFGEYESIDVECCRFDQHGAEMVKPLAVLLAVSGLAWGMVFLFAGREHHVPSILGMAIVLPPALFSMLAVLMVARKWPQLGVTVIGAGSALRMAWAVVAVAALSRNAELWETTASALAGWTTGFYLLLLTVETALLWGVLNGGNAPPPGTDAK